MEFTITEVLMISLGIGLGALVKGAIGFGLPMIATPLMLFTMPLPEVVAIMLIPALITNVQQCWLNRRHWRSLARYWPMIIATLIVMIPGSRMLVTLESKMLAAIVGGLIVAHAVIDSLPKNAGPKNAWIHAKLARFTKTNGIDRQKLLVPAGLLSGVLGSLTSIFSFPALQLMVSLRLAKDEFVFVIGVFLLSGYSSIWFGIALAGFPSFAIAANAIWVVIPGVFGLLAGNSLRGKIPTETFRRLINVTLGIAGISLMLRSIIF